jgi:hypothetical protein
MYNFLPGLCDLATALFLPLVDFFSTVVIAENLLIVSVHFNPLAL